MDSSAGKPFAERLKLQIPRASSQRKRSYGRLGMTIVKDPAARLKTRLIQTQSLGKYKAAFALGTALARA